VEVTNEHVIVIGSGPCGAMAAHELVSRGIPTTLLESGSTRPRGLVVRAAGNTIARGRPTGPDNNPALTAWAARAPATLDVG
jgi:2-polyprenyl-6-methoxyphenol hydroxylase-like FAD-dependent oxidoreductase